MVAFRAERLDYSFTDLPPPLRRPQKLGANLQLTYANRANVERIDY